MRAGSQALQFKNNKTGLQPVSRPVERVYYLGGGVGVQSLFDPIAVQTVTLLAMHVCFLNVENLVKLKKKTSLQSILKGKLVVLLVHHFKNIFKKGEI